MLVSFFVLASWFADLRAMAPCLLITGPATSEAHVVLRILRCLCRRSLLLGELTPAAFGMLPFFIRPTLILAQEELRPSMERLLLVSSRRELHIQRAGKFLRPYCAKAIFSPAIPGIDLVNGSILVSISPARATLPVFDSGAENKLRDHIQPKLVSYRLENAERVRISAFDVPHFVSNLREIARSLGAAVEGDTDLQSRLVAVLEEQDTGMRIESWDRPESVILEALWSYVHDEKRDRVHAKEIAETFNAISVGRDETTEINPRGVGPKLKALGFRMGPLDNRGRGLRLTDSIRRRIHQLVRNYGVRGLQAYEPGCELCLELLVGNGGDQNET